MVKEKFYQGENFSQKLVLKLLSFFLLSVKGYIQSFIQSFSSLIEVELLVGGSGATWVERKLSCGYDNNGVMGF